jgi:hypothetical protein
MKKNNITVNKKDLAQLKKKFTELKLLDKIGLEQEISKTIMLSAKTMKKVAPVDTGNLIKNINFRMLPNTVGEIRSEAPYSGYVEFGGNKPKNANKIIPFFFPVVRKQIKLLNIRLKKRINKILKR